VGAAGEEVAHALDEGSRVSAPPPPLRAGERALLGAVAPAGAGVGGLGLATSFGSVTAAAQRWGFTSP
jgi:hypothetical protein